MIVYRYLSDKELELFKNNKVEELGNYFMTNRMINDFKYDNERYIHFFKDKKDVLNFQKSEGTYYSFKNFIAWFDIPEKELGQPYTLKSSKDKTCEEYILLGKNFNCDWLKGYVAAEKSVSEEELTV